MGSPNSREGLLARPPSEANPHAGHGLLRLRDAQRQFAELLFTLPFAMSVSMSPPAGLTRTTPSTAWRSASRWSRGAIAVGGISGAAFNPAVTWGATALGLFAWSTLWMYIAVQLIAGAAPGLAFRVSTPR